VVRSHGWYDLPPFTYDAASGVLRVTANSGRGAAELKFRGVDGGIEVASVPTLAPAAVRALTSRIFSLDVDLGEVASLLDLEAADGEVGDRGPHDARA